MSKVRAPYNFVPLSGKVFRPAWAGQISHDVPFADGLSGELEITLEASTPLCVGDRKDENNVLRPFVDADGRPAVPGSSLRGMLRNVVEIVGFARMQYTDVTRRYAVRDLNNRDLYTSRITKKRADKSYEPKVQSGWLRLRGGGETERVEIVPCKNSRVEFSDLVSFLSRFGPAAGRARKLFETGSKTSMSDKYEAWREAGAPLEVMFDPEPPKAHTRSKGDALYFSRSLALGVGSTKGCLVFTGQPSKTKHREFVFHGEGQLPVLVDDGVYRDFRFNHAKSAGERHGGDEDPNDEWSYWKRELRRGGRVPIFYLTDQAGRVESLGLAQMYRLAYRYSIGETLAHTSPDHHRSLPDSARGLDIAEALFGRVVHGKEVSQDDFDLRGRVSIGMLRLANGGEPTEVFHGILNQPKPTFYPAYVVQRVGTDGIALGDDHGHPKWQTYMDESAELRGWKRYPARSKVTAPPTPNAEQAKVACRWSALRVGTTFRGKIRFHNLRPQELGALLWSLDFGGQANLRHSLGFAKPFGFGVVRLLLGSARVEAVAPGTMAPSIEQCRAAFVAEMEANLKGGTFLQSEQLTQLLAMVDPARGDPEALAYMSAGNVEQEKAARDTKQPNEFVEARKRGFVLPEHVRFPNDSLRDDKLYPRESRDQRKKRLEREAKDAELLAAQQRLSAAPPKDKALHIHKDLLSRPDKDRQQGLCDLAKRARPSLFTTDDEHKAGVAAAFADTVREMRTVAAGGGPDAQKLARLDTQIAATKPNAPQRKDLEKQRANVQRDAEKESKRSDRFREFLAWLDGRA